MQWYVSKGTLFVIAEAECVTSDVLLDLLSTGYIHVV